MSATCNCYHVPSVGFESKRLKPTQHSVEKSKFSMNFEPHSESHVLGESLQAFADDDGNTYICEACPAGQQQLGAGAMACDACPAGTAKAEQSTEECPPCAAGGAQNRDRFVF